MGGSRNATRRGDHTEDIILIQYDDTSVRSHFMGEGDLGRRIFRFGAYPSLFISVTETLKMLMAFDQYMTDITEPCP